MKRQTFFVTFLILIFTSATIIAGMTPYPEDADESVSIKVRKGKIYPRKPHKPFKHTFDKVLTLRYSTGCNTVIAAEYYITHQVKIKGVIHGGYEGVISIQTALEILDANGNSAGGETKGFQNLAVRPILGVNTVFRKNRKNKYTWTTTSAGNYTVKGTGSGSGKWAHKKVEGLSGSASWNDDVVESGITVGRRTIFFPSVP